MKIIGVLLLLLCFFTACSEKHDHKGKTPLVEVSGKFLYQEDLKSVLPVDLSVDDSLLFAEHYIKDWIESVLLSDKAKSNIPDNEKINELVENYREALIVHTYQQRLIDQKLSEEIGEDEMKDYYEKNKSLFVVERPLIKGLFIKVPIKASGLNKVRTWYKKNTPENVEHLEKYSFQNAVNYEYFYDKWLNASDVIDKIPLKVSNPETYLEHNKQIEVRDSAYCYFLNVEDYQGAGEQKPYEFARQEIKDMLVNLKRVSFIQGVKDDLYEGATERNKIIYY